MYNYECFGLFGTDPITHLVSYLAIFVEFFFLCNHLMFYRFIYHLLIIEMLLVTCRWPYLDH
jgi:hypothetical protein